MQLIQPSRESFQRTLEKTEPNSLDFAVIVTGALQPLHIDALKATLTECARALRDGGLLFLQGRPDYLPELGVFLDRRLTFKYWIAVESAPRATGQGLPSVHAAVLLFSKGDKRFNVKRVRFPHQNCAFCGKSLRDWGGKTHLMHPDGCVISDVWTDLPKADNYSLLSARALDTIMRMMDLGDTATGIIGPKEGIANQKELPFHPDTPSFHAPTASHGKTTNKLADEMVNVVHHGDAVEILKRYPDNCIDLAFADPPYNLKKEYTIYQDGSDEQRYVDWCSAWLSEYVRVLKPTGSLYVVNLPRWTMYHASFLNERLHLRNWIAWDALSEPRGKLMPAHYGLLFYTKHPTDFTFNYDETGRLDSRRYCLRASCIRKRKESGADEKEPLTDIWWDVHRIRHRRDRDYHPCQLPDALMDRIIRLSSNPGDVVLDALCGTGTTPVAAAKLGRRYVAIDLDDNYVAITREKIGEVERLGYVERTSTRKPPRKYTKKELQLELRDLAAKLGRLPTPEDVTSISHYDLHAFEELFPTWGKALKAAKLETDTDGHTPHG